MQRTSQFYFARKLRADMTLEEKMFWRAIKDLQKQYGRWRAASAV